MHHLNSPRCSYCQSPAVDYDALFNPWCDVCRMRKWLINWGAQHQWLHLYFAQRHKTQIPVKELWVAFVKSARDHEVAEAWLRIALFERRLDQPFLGTERTHLSLPPPDQETFYADIFFRCTWEAQWACFFKSLQMEYTYLRGTKHEPADLPASTAFWLQNLSWYRTLAQGSRRDGSREPLPLETQTVQGAYFIVTGPVPALRERERREHARRFAMRTGKAVYLLEGRIGLPTHWDGCTIGYLTTHGQYLRPFHWYECLSCGAIGVFHSFFPEYRFCLCTKATYRDTTSRLVQAYVAARYAHFHDLTPLLEEPATPHR